MQQGPILFCAHCILVAHLAVRCSGLAAGGGAVISRRRSPDASEEGGLGRDARSGSGAGAAGGRPLEVSCGRVEEARPPEPRILFRRGGAEAPVEQLDATGAALPAELPLAVPPNGTLALAVCGVGNIRSEGLLDMAQPLSGLVGPVGEGARVRVEVFHSWNVEVAGGLTVPGSPHNASLPASLVPSLVTGPVGDEAEIKIECRNTGNVRLLAPHSELHISGSVVVRPAVDARGSDIMRGTIEVALTDTGNVLAASPAAAAASARTAVSASDGGHLVDAVVAAASIVNSRVRVSVERTANVAAAVLEVEHGNLINGVVSVKKGLKGSDVDLTVRQVGAFEGQHFSLRDGELVDELVDCDGDLVGSKIGLSAERLGNVRALSVNIEDGELVDEA